MLDIALQIFCQTAVLDAFNRESTSESSTSGTLDEHVKLMIGYDLFLLIISFHFSQLTKAKTKDFDNFSPFSLKKNELKRSSTI